MVFVVVCCRHLLQESATYIEKHLLELTENKKK